MKNVMKTNDYSRFKFRDDNRNQIDKNHVKNLINSIKQQNLLHLNPIIVNKDFEVINGQHRLLAAKELNLPIYYVVEDLECSAIPLLNISKSWSSLDYLNYYAKQGYDNYILLQRFMQKYELKINTVFALLTKQATKGNFYESFRTGLFKYNDSELEGVMENIRITQDCIRKITGYQPYLRSARFCSALTVVFKDPNFNITKWVNNIHRNIDKIGPRANTKQYLMLFQDVYNWKCISNKINVLDEN